MSKEVALINILQNEALNKSKLQTRESIGTKLEDDKFSEIRKATYYIEKNSRLETQLQQLAFNTSGLERKVQTLSYQSGNSEFKELFKGEKVSKGKKGDVGARGSKGVDGDKGAVGKKNLNGEKGAAGEKVAMGDIGLTGLAGSLGSRGLSGEKRPLGEKAQNGENGLPGLNGEHGKKGIKGEKGFIGNKGPIGDKGQTVRLSKLVQFAVDIKIHRTETLYNIAKIDCHNMGGYLVKIVNAFENWFLKSYITCIKSDKSAGDVWIGAHDFVREGRFVWEVDNTSLTYTDWYPGEPNNSGNKEDCGCKNPGIDFNPRHLKNRFSEATNKVFPCKFRAIKCISFAVLSVYTIKILFWKMPRRKLTIAQKWQVIGMCTTGLNLRRIAVQFGVAYSVISRLLKRHRERRTVDERERSGRTRKTSARELHLHDRALS
ncbi:unnamed protein product [Mytilus coruscus]|uniref:C-type lectin domain-containing protein n=1 Tax=Mytilus coruscus TaxID=42192 RepID=A0A6J8CFG6_MYTCO|nr:unnamed protein product [Mytilus coruscus]